MFEQKAFGFRKALASAFLGWGTLLIGLLIFLIKREAALVFGYVSIPLVVAAVMLGNAAIDVYLTAKKEGGTKLKSTLLLGIGGIVGAAPVGCFNALLIFLFVLSL